jgi:pyruvate dehydrogenase E2 component (dihydrolipoamide acetyltransferase)
MSQINTQVKDFAERAKNKKLTPAEIDRSTFTISNLGMFGIESFTSIINQPNSAILSIGFSIIDPIDKIAEFG